MRSVLGLPNAAAPPEPVTGESATESDAERAAESSMPERIGRFEVRERCGRGAFGTVYRAHDPQLDREVALKVPHPGSLFFRPSTTIAVLEDLGRSLAAQGFR